MTAETLIAELRANCWKVQPGEGGTLCGHCDQCRAADTLASLSRDQQEAETILKAACDRSWENETLLPIANIAANAIHWRNEEIAALRQQLAEAQQQVANARAERDALVGAYTPRQE